MIPIARTTVAPPASLVDAGGVGASELQAARLHYQNGAAATFGFKAYKGDDVKQALETLFKGKCAYCETFYGSSAPLDVEHYRPKAGVEDDNAHPGYWWVAMDWNNLLPSCIDCNRRRNQVIVVEGMSLEEAERRRVARQGRSSAGKKDAFPIRGQRSLPEDTGFAAEDALLLDPARHDPSQHLVFDLESPFSLALPAERGNAADPTGLASIQVYGLNRLGLVQARTLLLNELRVKRAQVLRFLQRATDSAAAPEQANWRNEALLVMDQLEASTKPDRPYSALAKAFLDKFKEDLRREIE